MGALDGKVVLVTGGGNGIGRACALIAAHEGARVVVNDLGGGHRGGDEGSAGPAEAVAAEIRAAGGEAAANSDSVTNAQACRGMVEQALDVFGGLHAVINPAGVLRDAMFHKMRDEDWEVVLEVHLRGSYNVCRAAIERFRDQAEGSFVLFSSGSGLIGNIGQANYAAAKMGIVGLSRIIALEGAARNVRSNVIAPVAWTRMLATVPVTNEAQARQREVFAHSFSPEQPAKLAVALTASREVSGQIFGARADELELYSQPRPIETLAAQDGWSVAQILAEAFPKMAASFTPLVNAGQANAVQQAQPS